MATGVRSFQVNGMPVASGVVNRFDSVTTSLCGLPRAPFTSRKPSPPAPPGLLITTIAVGIRLCLVTMPWITRAIWSAPPPVPAGTMNSTGRVGCHAALAGERTEPNTAATPTLKARTVRFMGFTLPVVTRGRFSAHLTFLRFLDRVRVVAYKIPILTLSYPLRYFHSDRTV